MANRVQVLFQDEHLLAADKPAGLPTIPDRYQPEHHCLRATLEKRFGKLWVVHRLDADTSGVVCLARDADTHRALSIQFQERETEKKYHAILDGCPNPEEGTVDKPIGKHPSRAGRMIISSKGKPSLSRYRLIERMGQASLAEIQIESGRTHQVRVHMQYLGTPLWVDPIYGRRSEFFLSEIKGRKYRQGKFEEERPLMRRQTLHAAFLRFTHPATGETLTIESPWPKDFKACVHQLRKWK